MIKHTKEKQCKSCNEILETILFFRHKNHKRGKYYNNICKNCEKRNVVEYRQNSWKGRVAEMHRRALERAKKHDRSFDITKEWIFEQIVKNDFKCELTNLPLEYSTKGKENGCGWKNRYCASLDRIDSNLGYTKDNVRIVCNRINLALGDCSDEQFEEFAIGFLKNRGYKIEKK